MEFETIKEAGLAERPEFFNSMANNPLTGRLDTLSVRQNLFKIIDTKSGSLRTVASIEGSYNGFDLSIPQNTIANYKLGSSLLMDGWVDNATVKNVVGVSIFDLSAGTSLTSTLSYYLTQSTVEIKYRTISTLPTFVTYKFFFLNTQT